MSFISHRCASVMGGATHAWAELIALAHSKVNIIDLGQGYPDFEGSAVARTRAAEALRSEPRHNQYSPIGGLAMLHQAISRLYRHRYGAQLDPATEVLCLSSGTESLYCVAQTLINPGDKVVIFEPFFPWYLPHIKLAGGEPLVVPLLDDTFEFDREAVRAAFAQRPKMVVMNTPHNPTGRVFRDEELQFIADLCQEFDVLALSDEAYESITFPGHPHRRLADVPGMQARTLTMGTSSKLLSLTGWRIGWLTGPAALIAPVKTMHSYVTYCPPTPLQVGVTEALNAMVDDPAAEAKETTALSAMMGQNAEDLRRALEEIQGVKVFPPEGGYFLVANVAGSGMDDLAFCRWLIEQRNINAVPMRIFYTPAPGKACTAVRFAICKQRATIERALQALKG